MPKLSIKNTKHASPAWLVNLTAVAIFIATFGPDIVDKMPGGVSDLTKEWLHWVLGVIATVLGTTTAMSRRSSDVVGDGTRPPKGPR